MITKNTIIQKLALKYDQRIELLDVNVGEITKTSPIQLHCRLCGLTFVSTYRTLFASDTKHGCFYCKHNKKYRVFGFTNDVFIQEAHSVWGDHFTYLNLDLKKDIKAKDQNIDVYCNACHKCFKTNVRAHLYANLKGGGCLSCAKRINLETQKWTKDFFVEIATEKWGHLYDYTYVDYINCDTPVTLYCHTHQDYFLITPYKHLNNKYGCQVCGNKRKNDHTKHRINSAFKAEIARRTKDGMLDLTHAKYTGFLSPVCMTCLLCGCSFSTIGQHFIAGGGRCPVCYPPRSYSKPSRDAIKRISDETGLSFVSSLTGYEYSIIKHKNKLKVDAYNEDLNLVVEFYGDLFHGNPNLFSPEMTCHPYNKNTTAHELYTKTKEREQYILKAGYNLITIWESDWNNNSDAVLTRINTEIDVIKKNRK